MADNTKFYVMRGDKVLFESMTKEEIITAIVQAVEEGEIGDLDTGFVTKVKEQNHNNDLKFWRGTNAEYNALHSIDPNTYYIITDQAGHTHTLLDNDLSVTGDLNVGGDLKVNGKIDGKFLDLTVQRDLDVGGDVTAETVKPHEVEIIDNYESLGYEFQNLQNSNRIGLNQLINDEHGNGVKALEIYSDNAGYSNDILGKEISSNFDDMFWRELPLNEESVWAVSYGGYPKPMFRKVGDRVDIVGSVSCTDISELALTLATLPEGFRPNGDANVYWFATTSGHRIARLFVSTNGNIKLEWLLNISDGSDFDGEVVTWVQLNTSFYILDENNTIVEE